MPRKTRKEGKESDSPGNTEKSSHLDFLDETWLLKLIIFYLSYWYFSKFAMFSG